MGFPDTALQGLQQRIGYSFRDPGLLEEALRHPSVASTGSLAPTNQRLEFLGDAVLQLIVSEELFRLRPEAREGVLTKQRSALTRGVFLANVAQELGLPPMLRLGPSEENTGGRRRPSAMEDAFEALVGAIYLDGGYPAARDAVLRWFGSLDARLASLEHVENPKGRLQEIVQPNHGNTALRYEVSQIKGPDHERRFEVHLYFLDRLVGTGAGGSKKEAEENAARAALATWKTSAPN